MAQEASGAVALGVRSMDLAGSQVGAGRGVTLKFGTSWFSVAGLHAGPCLAPTLVIAIRHGEGHHGWRTALMVL